LLSVLALAPAVPAGGAATPSTRAVAVYLVKGERMAPVRRWVPRGEGVSRVALAALFRGATAAERVAGYTSAVPSHTKVLGVSLHGGVATVDLSGGFASGGGSVSMLLRVAQVVHTATQFAGVRKVAFRLDGEPVETIGGEGVIVAPAVGRTDFEGQAPPILVESPLPGDRVGAQLVVRGTANVFEARLDVDLVRPDGTRLAHRAVSASAGTGTRGTFSLRIATTHAPRRFTVVVYSLSAKDGSRIHLVEVPLRMTKPGS